MSIFSPPVITLAYTVGDLRRATVPEGSFPSPEGARLYGLCLGIPPSALHVEPVTTEAPVSVHHDRDVCERAAKAYELARGLSESFQDKGDLLALLTVKTSAYAQGEVARLHEQNEAHLRDLNEAERRIAKLEEEASDAAALTQERDELQEDLDALKEAVGDLLGVLDHPLGLAWGHRAGLGMASRTARERVEEATVQATEHAKALEALDGAIDEYARDYYKPTESSDSGTATVRDAVAALEALSEQIGTAKSGLGDEAVSILRGLGVDVIAHETVRAVSAKYGRPKASPEQEVKSARSEGARKAAETRARNKAAKAQAIPGTPFVPAAQSAQAESRAVQVQPSTEPQAEPQAEPQGAA